LDFQILLDQYMISILNGLARGVLLFTIAAGLSLLFGLLNVLNLAHGAFLVLGGYVAVSVALDGTGFMLAALLALGLGILLGGGLSAALWPIRNRGHFDQAILTLGIAFILIDFAHMLWGHDFYSPRPPTAFARSVEILGSPYPTYRLLVIVIGIVIAVAVFFTFERTRFGAIVRATVSDRDMAAALGIRVGLVSLIVFSVASGLAAFGGVVGGPILGVRPALEMEILVLALIVVVIGGLGSLSGALVGAILIGQIQSLGVLLIPAFAPFLLFGTMVLILIFRPAGLFGRNPG
jgi:branched-chain amino acid transport system permease protein